MKTSDSNAWWREMGAISRGMMFIEGAIATPITQDRAEQDVSAATRSHPSPPSNARRAKQKKKTFGLYEDLLFLGGRPMTAGHNDDIDESFPQTYDESAVAPARRRRGFGEARREEHPASRAPC